MAVNFSTKTDADFTLWQFNLFKKKQEKPSVNVSLNPSNADVNKVTTEIATAVINSSPSIAKTTPAETTQDQNLKNNTSLDSDAGKATIDITKSSPAEKVIVLTNNATQDQNLKNNKVSSGKHDVIKLSCKSRIYHIFKLIFEGFLAIFSQKYKERVSNTWKILKTESKKE